MLGSYHIMIVYENLALLGTNDYLPTSNKSHAYS